jgi:glycosyltransferase involved in cell wall biosynthesis
LNKRFLANSPPANAKSPYSIDEIAAAVTPDVARLRDKRVFFDGVFRADYSLAIANRHLARALLAAGVDLTMHSPEESWPRDEMLAAMSDVRSRFTPEFPRAGSFDIHLRNTWPPRADDMIGKFNAYVCYAWEELEYPPDLVEHFNEHLDLVMVTSEFVRYSLLHSGLTIPVEVVGDGTDHFDTALGAIRPLAQDVERSRFLHVSSCFPRKGADVLVRAFASGFSARDPIELVIKTFPNPHNMIESIVADAQREFPDAPPIRVINKTLTNDEMASLYRETTAVVGPSRGEGFGLPFAEAMLAGVPVITTGYSGQTDFCTPDTAWIVGYRLTPSTSHVTGAYGVWAEPDRDSLIEQMRRILAEPAEAERRSRNAAALLRAHFKWSDVARRVTLAIDQLDTPQGNGKAKTRAKPFSIDLVSTWSQKCGVATYSEHLFETAALGPSLHRVLARQFQHDAIGARVLKLAAPKSVLRPWGYDFEGVRRLAQQLNGGSSDVLWFQHHSGFFSLEDMLTLSDAAKAGRYRLRAITLHNVLEARAVPAWLDAFDLAFVHTPADAELLSRAGYNRSVVIPHGVLSTRSDERSAGDAFTVGTFGFLNPHKSICNLVSAVARAKLIIPDIRLKLFTCAQNHDKSRLERARVEALIEAYSLQSAVEAHFDFLPDADILQGLRSCDLLCFPYGESQESATGAVRIAMAADRPLLCSTSSVLKDVAPYAHVVRDNEPVALAEAIIALAGHKELLAMFDPERRQYVERHSYERIAQRYAAHFEYLLRTKP